MLPRASWRDERARYVRPTTCPNSRSDVNAARRAAAQRSIGSPARPGSHVASWTDPCLHSSHVQRRHTPASGLDSSERDAHCDRAQTSAAIMVDDCGGLGGMHGALFGFMVCSAALACCPTPT